MPSLKFGEEIQQMKWTNNFNNLVQKAILKKEKRKLGVNCSMFDPWAQTK